MLNNQQVTVLEDELDRYSIQSPSNPHELKLLVEIAEGGAGTDQPHSRRSYYVRPNEPLHVNCSDKECQFGGFDIAPFVYEMRRSNEQECLRIEICDGVKIRNANYVRCQHLFRVFIKLETA